MPRHVAYQVLQDYHSFLSWLLEEHVERYLITCWPVEDQVKGKARFPRMICKLKLHVASCLRLCQASQSRCGLVTFRFVDASTSGGACRAAPNALDGS